MNTVEFLEETLQWARRMGYQVRQEYLGGAGGGCCEVGGRRILFVDLALSAAEQLDRAIEALEADMPLQDPATMSPVVRQLMRCRKAA